MWSATNQIRYFTDSMLANVCLSVLFFQFEVYIFFINMEKFLIKYSLLHLQNCILFEEIMSFLVSKEYKDYNLYSNSTSI